jgi:hypothetical protein
MKKGEMSAGEASSPPTFPQFVHAWNESLELKTPKHHGDIADWLAKAAAEDQRRLLLMAFRGAGKSTVVGLFAAWLLKCDPNRRLMVVAADLRLARKMVRNVQRIIERHPDTQGLKPAKAVQWGADEFTVNRSREQRDPSMLARSVAANFTGSRADVIICDDVEVPNTCDTAVKRADLREKLTEIDYVLVPGGLQLYVGTPHSYYSLYAAEPRAEISETRPFLDGFDRYVLPVWDENHVPAWPGRFTVEHIRQLRKRHGEARFKAHMLLQPVNQVFGRLDPDRLRQYADEPVYREAAGRAVLTLGDKRLLSASAWWDPAFARPDEDGAGGGDSSVFAVVFGGEDGALYIHRVVYIRTDRKDPAPEARQQCRIVAAVIRELNLPAAHVETNGLGAFLPGLLREELRRERLAASVVEQRSTQNKAQRIIEAFEAPMADGRVFAHRSVWDTPFVREMREWRPNATRIHDDGLDAAAGALSCEPWRFDRSQAPAGPCRADWRPGAVTAPSDWKV